MSDDFPINWNSDLPESGPEPKRRKTTNDGEHLRCPNYTDEENFLIAHLFKEHQEILRDHRNTTKINRLKNAIWQLIADTISSRPGATTRTAEQVRRRWKTMLGQERSLEAILRKYQTAIINKDVKKQQPSTGASTPTTESKSEFSLDSLLPIGNNSLNSALKTNLDNFLALLANYNNGMNDDNQSSINDENDYEASYSYTGAQNSESNNPEDDNASSTSMKPSKQSNFTVEILTGTSLNDQILNPLPQSSSSNGDETSKTGERNSDTPNDTGDMALKNLLTPQVLKQNYYSLALKAEKDLREAKQKAEEEKIRREDELFQQQLEKERAQIRLYDAQRELAEAQTYLIKLKTKLLEANVGKKIDGPFSNINTPLNEDDINIYSGCRTYH